MNEENNVNVVTEIDEITDVVEAKDSTATGVIVGAVGTAAAIGVGYLIVKGIKKAGAAIKNKLSKDKYEDFDDDDEDAEIIDYDEQVAKIHEQNPVEEKK